MSWDSSHETGKSCEIKTGRSFSSKCKNLLRFKDADCTILSDYQSAAYFSATADLSPSPIYF